MILTMFQFSPKIKVILLVIYQIRYWMISKKITIIIQARVGSRRFPRKVLSKIENKPMIWHVINRAKQVKGVDQIILATTKKHEDNILTKIAKHAGILSFTGSAQDVLSRYYDCAIEFRADPIVRITGDCPLIDPKIVSKLLKIYMNKDYNYVTNTMPATYPDGLDTEIFSFRTLEKISRSSIMKSEREHVTPYIKKNKNKFKTFNLRNKNDLSGLRWTVDEKKDLLLVRKIYEKMRPKLTFGFEDTLKVLEKNPKIAEINKGIMRNEGYHISLRNDNEIKHFINN
jgi:spore coat polysaccharide biosynthesis protein SpsF (cytidylyltransferase family)